METANIPLKKYFLYSLVLIILLVIYQWISSPMVVTVTGVGEVSAKAETATLTFVLSSNNESPQSASDKVKETLKKIKETLKTSGIPESDIYEASTVILPASSVVAGATGYQATLNMGVKTTQINNLDGITASLYSQGAVVVTQPILSVGDKEKLEKEAYDLALKNVKKQSNNIAFKYLKLFKKIVLVQESQTSPSSTVTSKADTVAQIDKNLSSEDGLIKISKVLSVSYKMW